MSETALKEILVGQIERNPDNPRLFFRSEEMGTLMASISRYGIQVPITVYEEGRRYFLIDGERRWRCAGKLNLKRIPAIIQPKPSPLDNLVLMFNIHALREQWDYFTIANKLPVVIERYASINGRDPNEAELSELTGLTRGQIRRCRFLLDLPEKYKISLVNELSLPKQKQQLSEDFFIEMERSLKTVEARVPNAITHLDEARDSLIHKFRTGVIGNITDFRKLSKIATAVDNLGVRQQEARAAIRSIFKPDNKVGISKVFTEHFELRYDERKVALSIRSLSEYLESIGSGEDSPKLDEALAEQLRGLRTLIDRILGDE
jgi:ParB/RepB/Spo0J family partition protein